MAATLEPPAATSPDYLTPSLADELVEVLSEAAVEIFNFAGNGNPVVARLRNMRDRIQQAQIIEASATKNRG